MALRNIDANEFLDNALEEKYLLKLVPDFGVFDIAEKYFIDGNAKDNNNNVIQEGIYNLFFYKTTKTNSKININEIPFKRFICKSDGEITVTPDNNNYINYDVLPLTNSSIDSIDGVKYKIIIDEQDICEGFSVSTNGNYLIGVCF